MSPNKALFYENLPKHVPPKIEKEKTSNRSPARMKDVQHVIIDELLPSEVALDETRIVCQ